MFSQNKERAKSKFSFPTERCGAMQTVAKGDEPPNVFTRHSHGRPKKQDDLQSTF